MTERVWILPRVLLAARRSDPAVFHPYRVDWIETRRTDCGLRIETGYLARQKMLVGDRQIIELIAIPCRRCYSKGLI